ncbi:hypothetical protein GCM10025871_05200 [Deinococcus metallilatus]|nr:hypothetical protein GCM10025871_05200 [Deinococcus metallilatus]
MQAINCGELPGDAAGAWHAGDGGVQGASAGVCSSSRALTSGRSGPGAMAQTARPLRESLNTREEQGEVICLLFARRRQGLETQAEEEAQPRGAEYGPLGEDLASHLACPWLLPPTSITLLGGSTCSVDLFRVWARNPGGPYDHASTRSGGL